MIEIYFWNQYQRLTSCGGPCQQVEGIGTFRCEGGYGAQNAFVVCIEPFHLDEGNRSIKGFQESLVMFSRVVLLPTILTPTFWAESRVPRAA